MSQYYVERMGNGMIYVKDRVSGLSGCFNSDWTYRHGDLRAVPSQVRS